MRQVLPLCTLLFASLLWIGARAAAQADQPGPFPSPSPSVVPAAGNGYVWLGFNGAGSSGGQVPPRAGSTATPRPFVNASTTGFSLHLLGRISDSYLAALKFEDYSVHGNDTPFVSYSQGLVLYNPHASNLAFGVGYLSLQRSTSSVSVNGGGFGAMLLPRFKSGASAYASAFFYPIRSRGSTSSISSLEAGVIFSPPRRGGFFYHAGAFAKNGGNASVSPTQISGLTAGVGASF